MKTKTADEVKAEIKALKELAPLLPNHKDGIQACHLVLEKGLSHDDVFDLYEGSETFDDAHSALLWRDGHNSNVPSQDFRDML
jgi:hypothetical protein